MATKVEGRERLLAKMRALPVEVRSAIKQALAQGADEITDMQKRLAPVSATGSHGNPPGALRDSIVQTWGGDKARYSSLAGSAGAGDPDLTVRISAGNSKVRYAHLVEFGTSPHPNGGKFKGTDHPGTTAQPFFYPAYRALRKRVKSRISRATNKAAKKVAGK
ncbi:HK97-gp10 family putative phage morphogenesis protein [Bradyrhizobium sp. I71]|uniref:HK97-gp10 family putative phage morphogenesis protein n=1 Tax=Bradyrhizobium sp. I71 TaxID=2590772 RepID=UPI001EF7F63F|nr:HK97-gp10 family putative phage morphogenesis protein [Bradyrhizobium sp. I71]ULK98844.1 HK97 gp10 family phage protein [Bradyrhizobium sp. I71]